MTFLRAVPLCFVLLLAACTDQPRVAIAPQSAPTATTRPSLRSEAAITPTRDPAAESTVQIAESTHALAGVNLRMADLISVAYRTPEHAREVVPLLSALRVVSPEPLPTGRYDVRIVIPGAKAPDLRAALARLLADSFGLSVRRELRDSPVYVLANPADRLGNAAPRPTPPLQPDTVDLHLTGDDLALLAEQLEECMQRPIVNETGRRTPYDLHVRRPRREGRPQPIDPEIIRAALKDQLGLGLIPVRRQIEFLVVERRPS